MIRHFTLFALVGAVSTACHFAVLFLLHDVAGWGVVVATTVGATTGAVVNYLLNRRITFAQSEAGAEAVPRFAVVAISVLALNASGMALLQWATPSVHYLIRQCVVSSVVLIYSFTLNRAWTFGVAPRERD